MFVTLRLHLRWLDFTPCCHLFSCLIRLVRSQTGQVIYFHNNKKSSLVVPPNKRCERYALWDVHVASPFMCLGLWDKDADHDIEGKSDG